MLYNQIILEGIDGSGKSTLSKILTESIDLIPHHSNRTEGLCQERILIDSSKKNYVFDRSFIISESIYGPILRGTSPYKIDFMIDYLTSLNPLIVYLRPPTGLLEGRRKYVLFDKTKPETKPLEHRKIIWENYHRILRNYDQLMKQLSTKVLMIQINPMNEYVVKMLLLNLKRRFLCVE